MLKSLSSLQTNCALVISDYLNQLSKSEARHFFFQAFDGYHTFVTL